MNTLYFCLRCGFYPQEERRRKSFCRQNDKHFNKRHKKPIMLKIQHTGAKTTYKLTYVEKPSQSTKTDKVSDTAHTVEK